MMYRWLWASLTILALALPAAAEEKPAAPAGGTGAKPPAGGAAAASAPGAGGAATNPNGTAAQPEFKLELVPVPMMGQPVPSKAEFAGYAIKQVRLLKRREATGETAYGAEVRVVNTSAKPVEPNFRVILYNATEPLVAVGFPGPVDAPPTIGVGQTYVWTKWAVYEGKKLPDGFAVAPPEQVSHQYDTADPKSVAGKAVGGTGGGTGARGGAGGRGGGRGGAGGGRGGRGGRGGGGKGRG